MKCNEPYDLCNELYFKANNTSGITFENDNSLSFNIKELYATRNVFNLVKNSNV